MKVSKRRIGICWARAGIEKHRLFRRLETPLNAVDIRLELSSQPTKLDMLPKFHMNFIFAHAAKRTLHPRASSVRLENQSNVRHGILLPS